MTAIVANEVTVTFEIVLAPEVAAGFGRMDASALEATRTFPGFIEVRIVQHQNDPCRFLFIERWASEAAYRAYIAFRTQSGQFEPLLAAAIKTDVQIWSRTIAAA